jgi:hypothetical protein
VPENHFIVIVAIDAISRLLQADEYLRSLLAREAVDNSAASSVLGVQAELMPLLRDWAGSELLAVQPSGSFAKGTAIRSATDIDLFISLAGNARQPLREVYEGLSNALYDAGFEPRRQNVSVNIRVNGYYVDLVPGHRQNAETAEHSLYVIKHDTWIKTNVLKHIAYVRAARRQDETRILKLWRNQQELDFPSFYLELAVIRVLGAHSTPYLSANVHAVFEYLRDTFWQARFLDPANSNNVISDALSETEKRAIAAAARAAIGGAPWKQVVM